MVLREIVPRHGRVAIGGISMGGYGALLLGPYGHFCAIGGHSPALWFSGWDSAAGAREHAPVPCVLCPALRLTRRSSCTSISRAR
jgi:S-formylglutathione hydrolase FrmB